MYCCSCAGTAEGSGELIYNVAPWHGSLYVNLWSSAALGSKKGRVCNISEPSSGWGGSGSKSEGSPVQEEVAASLEMWEHVSGLLLQLCEDQRAGKKTESRANAFRLEALGSRGPSWVSDVYRLHGVLTN